MRRFLIPACLLTFGLLFVGSASAQTFQSEQDIAKTIQIPTGVLISLAGLDQARECESTLGKRISKKWFVGAKIDLNGDKYADLIVKNIEGCMSGPRAANWWVFAGGPKGYRKVFEETGAAITIGKLRNRGFRDIRHEIVMLEVYRNTWKYDGRNYQLAKTDRIKID